MATKSRIELMVETTGLGQAVKDSKEFNKNMKGGAAALKNAKSQSFNAAREENQEYNRGRGASGQTGAQARDFANQAQGLGGLVRLYATYAANLFAVSAAYTALSKAQDTANMVKGLDQLGAASGMALGNLSKQLVKATDGAVSLREAMEATVKASSSGMSGKDILRMGEVAKKASQALGVDMSDALSRISRGITKLEPELLDEIGIFTRIDPAVQAYAKSVNKSVSSLTQFERQMAFQNAVLAEGEAKFSEINIETNAYTKLLAELKNTATGVGDALNKVLVPIVSLLASNPMVLFGTLATFVTMIAKQALPALMDFRQSMIESTAAAATAAEGRLNAFKSLQQKAINEAKSAADNIADDTVEAWGRAEEKLRSQTKGLSKRTQEILSTKRDQPFDYSKEDLAYLKERQEMPSKIAPKYRALHDTIIEAQKAETAYYEKTAAANEKAAQTIKNNIQYRANEILALRASRDIVQANIVSNTAETASIQGMSAAWRSLREEVSASRQVEKDREKSAAKTSKTTDLITAAATTATAVTELGKTGANTAVGLTRMGAAATLARGGFAVLTQGISTVLGVLGPWAALLGIVVSLGTALYGMLSKNAKQAQEFSGALDALQSATDTYTKYAERAQRIQFTEFFQVKNLEAQTQAIGSLAQSIEDASIKLRNLQKANQLSWIDSFGDSVSSFFGGGANKNYAKGMQVTISSMLESMKDQPMGLKGITEELKQILNVSDPTNIKELNIALRAVADSEPLQKKLAEALKKQYVSLGNASQAAKSFKDQLKQTADASKELTKQFESKDPVTKYVVELIKTGKQFEELVKNQLVVSLEGMQGLFDSIGTTPIFQEANVNSVLNLKTEFESATKAIEELRKEKQKLDAEKVKPVANNTYMTSITAGKGRDWNTIRKQGDISAQAEWEQQFIKPGIDPNTAKKAAIDAKIKEQEAKLTNIGSKVTVALTESVSRGYKTLGERLNATLNNVQDALREAVLSALGNLPGAAEERGKQERSNLSFEFNLISIQEAMLRETIIQRELMEKSTAIQEAVSDLEKAKENKNVRQIENALEKYDKATAMKVSTSAELTQGGLYKRIQTAKAGEVNTLTDNMFALAGMEKAKKEIAQQMRASKFKEQIAVATSATETRIKEINDDSANKKNSVQDLETRLEAQGTLSDVDFATLSDLRAALVNNALSVAFEQANLEIQKLAIISGSGTKLSEDAQKGVRDEIARIAANRDITEPEKARQELNKANIGDSVKRNEYELKLIADSNELLNIKTQREENILNIKEAEISLLSSTNMLFGDELKSRTEALEQDRILYTYKLAQQQAYNTLIEEEEKLKRDIKLAQDKGYDIDPKLVDLRRSKQSEQYMLAIGAAITAKNTSQAVLDVQKEFNDRGTQYMKTFEDSINGLGDALVEFTKTGKFAFKDMINSMLEDLLRYEMKQMTMNLWKGLRSGEDGGILGSFMKNTLPSMFGAPTTDIPSFQDIPTASSANAKGNAFSGGIEKFAKGGTFTNSIVSSPTLFKFAKGTGLMGEAGPEAIMPLKRDSNGNLGVRTNQSNQDVSVVVNNYSNATATTKETVDSNGNKRIEVIVGEMVAGEMSRQNSPVQQSMHNTFGNRPQMVRR